jgi:hypothetical protein
MPGGAVIHAYRRRGDRQRAREWLVELNRIFCDKQISPYLPNPAL